MPANIKLEDSQEINLIDLIFIIWTGKWKIISITSACIVFMLVYFATLKKNNEIFLASTKIIPIQTFEETKYGTYNRYLDQIKKKDIQNKILFNNDESFSNTDQKSYQDLSFAEINKTYLLNLFLEQLSEGEVLKNAIKKFNLLEKENFKHDTQYEEEVTKLASSISLIPPKIDDQSLIWTLNFKTTNIEKWQSLLGSIEKPLNEKIRLYLIENFEQLILEEKKKKLYKIEDLDQKILNAKINYENQTSSKIAYLEEQAKLARRLDIKKNNLVELQSFATDTGIITNLRTDIPYYMRGYEMIEKEIELIKGRSNTELFIEQLQSLQAEKMDLSTNKHIERIESLISETPILYPEKFSSAKLLFLSTGYKKINQNDKSKSFYLILACIFGFIISTIYILIESQINIRKQKKK